IKVMKLILAFAACAACALAQNPLTQAVTASYNGAKTNLIETAAAMPAEDYGFKLTPAQRPFGEWIEHTAMGNYSFCSAIAGTKPPAEAEHAHGVSGKAAIEGVLKASFEYCDGVLKTMTDQKALTEVTIGDRKSYPAAAMVRLVGSLNEHYGNLVGYLRSKGVTPPSTARQKKK
ncbi:MAG: DinB family protein, partial [Bryobacteraceae bacterium]